MQVNDIIDVLKDAGAFEAPLTLEAIDGGVVNLSYQLQSGANRYFVKVFELDELIPFDRLSVFNIQRQLADLGVAPKPVFLDPEHRFQVEDWVVHISLKHSVMSMPEKLNALAGALWTVHRLPVNAGALDLEASWHTYLNMLSPDKAGTYIAEVQQASEYLAGLASQDQVFCHNDLAFEHVSDAPSAAIFDWEYAAKGNRYFDIAASLMVNQLDNAQAEHVYREYARLSGIPVNKVRKQTEKQQGLVLLTNRLWYAAAETDAKNST